MSTFLATSPAQLGPILRGFRQAQGLTQKAFAARLGLAQKAISLAETHPDRMSTARLFELLGALGVELTLSNRPVSKTQGEW
jgi:HTH-type transcriptional regulator/antitoxin HipB